ncbi:MAG: hypothetical protein FJ109_07900 [Deltaproteobacteria bacterium]|nr:hypothetical protein [Deltaproteobacteria bacterium]
MRTRDQIKSVLEAAIRAEFPKDTVDISDGYKENIHVLVVSRRFDKMTDDEQRDLLWGLIDRAGLEEGEKALISLALAVSPSMIK